ncbi:MAG: type II toxin-antitoxin system VapC family toxin [Deltaproteobacteria bacterium]|nr:type II toxin-antitoxin system VapC family toxin [Deltaproteobacteria bacterium]
MTPLIIDASVVLKWYLEDEEGGEEAVWFLKQHATGDLGLLAPALLNYEVVNALLVAERMGRIARETTRKAVDAFLELEIELCDPFTDYADILALARTFHRTIYDASYLSLAKKRGIDFVTGDKHLYNAVKDSLKWVKWVGGDIG